MSKSKPSYDQHPTLAPWMLGGGMVILGLVVFVIARGLLYVAKRTESKYDDIVVAELHPYRFTWIAPLLVIYYFAGLLPAAADIIRQVVLFLILYLRSRLDAHQEGMTLLVRQLAPGPTGLPLEIYGFTRTVEWAECEAIQAEIIDHLLAAMPRFDLRVFQQPTGLDL